VPDKPRAVSAASMSKKPHKKGSVRRSRARVEEMRPEYDFSKATPNPYATRFKAGATVIVLDPDVAESFPDALAVNTALRTLAGRRQRP
jgi:hypothetical protein